MTKEKVYIVAGPKFNKLENHILIINKALHVLEVLDQGGMKILQIHYRIWSSIHKRVKKTFGCGEMGRYMSILHIACYVDDLCIVAKDPKGVTDLLHENYGYKLKCTGPISYHIGFNYF